MSFPRKHFLESQTYHEWDWDELQNNIGNYYDTLIADHISSGSPHPYISLDSVLQGTLTKKLSAAEYAKFLTGFYDILDSGPTVKFGEGRSISGFYFANGADADGANIYANDLFSRGKPVYVLAHATSWFLINSGAHRGPLMHLLGYRPSFGILQVSFTDPTGQPEEYIYTENYGQYSASPGLQSYACWNNTYWQIYNYTNSNLYFRLLLFAYMGA